MIKYYLKSAVILLCLLLLLSCSTDENPEEVPQDIEEITLFSVTLAPNYFPEVSDVEYSGAVYLTNEEGEVISSGKIINGSKTELRKKYDLSNKKLNLSFVRKIEDSEGIFYSISTYTDVDPYYFLFENPLVRPRFDKATVQILNTGSHLQHFIYNYPSFTGSVSPDEAIFDIRLNHEPGNLFFTVKKETEDFRRYFLQKNVMAGTEISLDFLELPPITNRLTLNFPENSSLFVSIQGAESTDPNNFYAGIDQVNILDGRISQTFAIPEELFQRYKLRMILEQNQKQYLLDEKTTSIKDRYDFPDWDLQASSTGSEFSFTSTNTADYYNAGFQYVPANQPYDIVWTVIGKKGNEMNFNLPHLQELFAQDIPDFNLEDLTLRSGSLIRIEGISNYKDFIMAQEDNFSSEKEKITKFENLTTML